MTVKLIWITPDADKLVGYMARVSNLNAKIEDDTSKLIQYLISHKHWSPLEMVSVCLEIHTTRDITRQILRHRSFHFQEFSQRYAEVGQVEPSLREARLQDHSNRQNSLPVIDDDNLKFVWENYQKDIWRHSSQLYYMALQRGIAKEQARALLPEGLTETKMYMSGTLRDWLHYLEVRLDHGTQREHRVVAEKILDVLTSHCPTIIRAAKSGGFTFGDVKDGEYHAKDSGKD